MGIRSGSSRAPVRPGNIPRFSLSFLWKEKINWDYGQSLTVKEILSCQRASCFYFYSFWRLAGNMINLFHKENECYCAGRLLFLFDKASTIHFLINQRVGHQHLIPGPFMRSRKCWRSRGLMSRKK
jgi:hypothetical protein